MKTLCLTVSRPQIAIVTVTVPDDFDTSLIYRTYYGEAFYEPLDDADVWRDSEYGEEVEVECMKVLTGDELTAEIHDFGPPVDLSEAIAAVDAKRAVELQQRQEKKLAMTAAASPVATAASDDMKLET